MISNTPPKNRKYITPEEAADILRVTPDTIKKWLRNGKLKGSKLGGKNGEWRTTIKSCEEMYDEGKNS